MTNQNPLVSIIIPTYNRAHLIGETLDSILAQTYQNWECIVVDDGSTDDTFEVVTEYKNNDSRFHFYQRPKEHLRGGSGARNFGFKMSKGEYVQWFDSDDLMVSEKLEKKVQSIREKNVDLLISKGKYFNINNHKDYQYAYKEEEINLMSYTTKGITWYTSDMMMCRQVAELIQFNEYLHSGQEGNYSYKILLETNSIGKIDEVLTLRRYHDESIGVARRKERLLFLETTFASNWITLNELREKYLLPKEFEKYVFLRGVRLYLQHKNIRVDAKFHKVLIEIMGVKAIYFYLADITNRLFGRYIFFYSKMK